MLRALIFDVDGTLAETEEAHRTAFNAAFDEHGLGWVWDAALYGQLLKTTGGKERISAWMRDHLGQAPKPELIQSLHADKTRRYVALIEGGLVSLRPGIAELIARGRAEGLRLAVATTTSRVNVDQLSRAVLGDSADAIFDVIAAGDEVARKKPAPDVYQLALDRLALRAEDCLALEDSAIGVAAARAAGLAVVACPSRYTATDDLSAATLVVDSFDRMAFAPDLADVTVAT